jgi:hypothetical protein
VFRLKPRDVLITAAATSRAPRTSFEFLARTKISWISQRPKSLLERLGWPDVVAIKADVLPAERGNMGKQLIGQSFPLSAKLGNGVAEIRVTSRNGKKSYASALGACTGNKIRSSTETNSKTDWSDPTRTLLSAITRGSLLNPQDTTVFDFRAYFCHSAPMETHAFGFALRAKAPGGAKAISISLMHASQKEDHHAFAFTVFE